MEIDSYLYNVNVQNKANYNQQRAKISMRIHEHCFLMDLILPKNAHQTEMEGILYVDGKINMKQRNIVTRI